MQSADGASRLRGYRLRRATVAFRRSGAREDVIKRKAAKRFCFAAAGMRRWWRCDADDGDNDEAGETKLVERVSAHVHVVAASTSGGSETSWTEMNLPESA